MLVVLYIEYRNVYVDVFSFIYIYICRTIKRKKINNEQFQLNLKVKNIAQRIENHGVYKVIQSKPIANCVVN